MEFMRKICAIFFLFASSIAWADCGSPDCPDCREEPPTQCCVPDQCVPYQGELVPPCTLPLAYNAPAGIHVARNWNFSLDLSFIYWEARERGLNFAFVIPKNPNAETAQNIYNHFNFHPGFQLRGAMDLQYDGWEGFLTYGRLRLSESVSTGVPAWGLGIEPLWLADVSDNGINGSPSGPFISQVGPAQETWHFAYDMFDFGLARPSYTGRSLILSPFGGFRTGLMTQSLRITYTVNTLPVLTKLKQMIHLLGPRAGVEGKFLFGYGLRFQGNTALALLYQVQNSYMNRANFASPSITQINVHDGFRFFAPSVDLCMGMGWGIYFNRHSWYLDLSLSYDIHYYWNQNWMRHLKDSLDQRVAGHAEDLAIQGWTGTVKFNF